MQGLAWCFVNEQDVLVGGRRHAKPIGPLVERGRDKLVKRVTAAVLAAEGTENTMVEAPRLGPVTPGFQRPPGSVL
ncbi:hypothetical protein [Nonomuraea jiangxiensis]|uniref:Uncharacterized protein n=1 Tax=Nonomuraea jiangxiensis TaxID=633440 RepID=A0A1G9PML4_9ACTN|nr:hypothetical protein [Nonomuraea jiangxiensis]SDM00068.1 hypothetical protein SAMN05421869_13440 [Nonomuraea jiangxiensis]